MYQDHVHFMYKQFSAYIQLLYGLQFSLEICPNIPKNPALVLSNVHHRTSARDGPMFGSMGLSMYTTSLAGPVFRMVTLVGRGAWWGTPSSRPSSAGSPASHSSRRQRSSPLPEVRFISGNERSLANVLDLCWRKD